MNRKIINIRELRADLSKTITNILVNETTYVVVKAGIPVAKITALDPKTRNDALKFLSGERSTPAPEKKTALPQQDLSIVREYIGAWNTIRKTNFKVTDQYLKPLESRLRFYSMENLHQAIRRISYHGYWKDKNVSPIWLLRTKNPKGMDVDYIAEMLATASPQAGSTISSTLKGAISQAKQLMKEGR